MMAKARRYVLVVFAALAGLIGIMASYAFAQDAIQGSESVEADVSARSVSIEADFTGTEIVVFGTVENSKQPSAEAGTYDVIVVVEGTPAPLVVRKRSNLAGLWINTQSIRLASLPSYYAISSTRPINEIAETPVLDEHGIGFAHVRMVEAGSSRVAATDPNDMEQFRHAVVRLKQRDGLYVRADYGVGFVGRSLFRSTIKVPPNVPIGRLTARVYLFREGTLLGQYKSEVSLARAGIERFLHDAAIGYSLLYGLGVVLFAVGAGLASAYAFRREA